MELSPLHCTTCNVYRPSLNKLRNDASFFIGHNSSVRKITKSSSLRNERTVTHVKREIKSSGSRS